MCYTSQFSSELVKHFSVVVQYVTMLKLYLQQIDIYLISEVVSFNMLKTLILVCTKTSMILHFLPFFFWQFHNFSAFAIWFLLQNAFLQQGSLKLTFSLKVLQKKKRRGRGVLQKDFIILYILVQVISKRLNFNFIKHSLLNSRAFQMKL